MATHCYVDRRFVKFARDFLSGQGNTHCCAQKLASDLYALYVRICRVGGASKYFDELDRDHDRRGALGPLREELHRYARAQAPGLAGMPGHVFDSPVRRPSDR